MNLDSTLIIYYVIVKIFDILTDKVINYVLI